jgi:hypothetical protein
VAYDESGLYIGGQFDEKFMKLDHNTRLADPGCTVNPDGTVNRTAGNKPVDHFAVFNHSGLPASTFTPTLTHTYTISPTPSDTPTPLLTSSPTPTFFVCSSDKIIDRLEFFGSEVYAMTATATDLYVAGSLYGIFPVRSSLAYIEPREGNYINEYPSVVGNIESIASDGAGGWYIGGGFTEVLVI